MTASFVALTLCVRMIFVPCMAEIADTAHVAQSLSLAGGGFPTNQLS